MKRTSLVLLAVFFFCGPALGEWTVPVPVSEVNSRAHDMAPFLSYDGLTLHFARQDGPGWHYTRLYEATRDNPDEPFGSVRELSAFNLSYDHVDYPWISPDNLRMYYYRTVGSGRELMFTERTMTGDPWLPGVGISELNYLRNIATPSLTKDELIMVFMGYNLGGGEGGYDIWTASRADTDSAFSDVTNLLSVNSAAWDFHPSISPDGLSLVFASDRNGAHQLFRAARASTSEPFGLPEHLSFFDSPGSRLEFPFMSSDGTALYFTNSVSGADFDIYVSYIPEPGTIVLLGLGGFILRRRLR